MKNTSHADSQLRYSPLAPLLLGAYSWSRLRRLCVAALLQVEGGEFYSGTLRQILEKYHGVRVGAYSYGTCMVPGAFPAGVTVGRYVSVGRGVRVFLRNHPLERLSLHPFFFNHQLGWVSEDNISFSTLTIGHDAWIGANAIFTPGCSVVGIGAVVGAGAVVTRDVPDFAIVAGNPSRLIRFRFPENVCDAIKTSHWWELPVAECAKLISEMTKPFGESSDGYPLIDAIARAMQQGRQGKSESSTQRDSGSCDGGRCGK